MRVLLAEVKFSNFNDTEKFSIAACVLTQSYIVEKHFSCIKWNIMKMKMPADNVMPTRRPYNFSEEELSQLGYYKTFFKRQVGNNLSDVYPFLYKTPKFYSP